MIRVFHSLLVTQQPSGAQVDTIMGTTTQYILVPGGSDAGRTDKPVLISLSYVGT